MVLTVAVVVVAAAAVFVAEVISTVELALLVLVAVSSAVRVD
jgi:hypothetical protein